MKKNKFKMIIIIIFVLLMFNHFCPRKIDWVIGDIKNDSFKEMIVYENVDFNKSEITYVIEDKEKVKNVRDYILNQKVRKVTHLFNAGYKSEIPVNFMIGGNIKLSIIGEKYAFIFPIIGSKSKPYKFTDGFDVEEFRNILKENASEIEKK